jgi:hypothetical protein
MTAPQPEPEATDLSEDLRVLHTRLLSREALEAIPEATGIYRLDGTLVADNAAFCEFWRLPRQHELLGRLTLLTAPTVDRGDVDRFLRAREGTREESQPHPIDVRGDPHFAALGRKQLWMQTLFAPLRVDGVVTFVMITFRDRTDEMDNQSRVNEGEARIAEQAATIAALRAAQEHIRQQQDVIRELSTSIIEVWPGVLTLPVVGHIDEQRASEMTERLLTKVSALRARHVILDLTGVERLDAATAGLLLGILRAVPLLAGAR